MNNLQDDLTLRRVLRYILIEGSGTPEAVPSWLRDLSNKPRFGADTSETVCWKLLNVFVLNSNYIVYPMGGILALGKTLDYLIAEGKRLSESGIYLDITIIPDWFVIASTKEYIENTYRSKCGHIKSYNLSNIRLRLIKNYTFEWSVVTFPELIDWMYVSSLRDLNKSTYKNSELNKLIERKAALQQELMNLKYTPHLWADNTNLKSELDRLGIDFLATDTFERVCARSLSLITDRRPFACHKKSLGPCWYTECRSGQCFLIKNFKKTSNVPVNMKCGLLHKRKPIPTLKYKYTELWNKSFVLKRLPIKR